MAATYIEFDVVDLRGAHSKMRIRITDQALPTGVSAYANQIASDMFGAGLPSVGGLAGANLVITGAATPIVASSFSDVRQKWAANVPAADGEAFKFGIPARDGLESLLVGGKGIVADLSNTAFTAVLADLQGGGAIHWLSNDQGSVALDWDSILSTTRNRKRPRAGSR